MRVDWSGSAWHRDIGLSNRINLQHFPFPTSISVSIKLHVIPTLARNAKSNKRLFRITLPLISCAMGYGSDHELWDSLFAEVVRRRRATLYRPWSDVPASSSTSSLDAASTLQLAYTRETAIVLHAYRTCLELGTHHVNCVVSLAKRHPCRAPGRSHVQGR